MTVPAINFVTKDGGIGIQNTSGLSTYVYIGAATQGPIGIPQTFTRVSDVTSTFGTVGPMVEGLCYAISNYGATVGAIRTNTTVSGTCETIDVTGVTGTSVATIAGSPAPQDDTETVIKVVNGGTIGVTGITYLVSLDAGRNYGTTQALGTATHITVQGVEIDLATGTLVAGDTIKVRTHAPAPNASDLATPLLNLKNWGVQWGAAVACFPVDASTGASLQALCSSNQVNGKFKHWVGSWRGLNAGETDAQYQTAFAAFRASYSDIYANLIAGSCLIQSAVPGKNYVYFRAPSWDIAAKEASVGVEVNYAMRRAPGGALPGVSIMDLNGNVVGHNEFINPGLDDLGATVRRTWPDLAGCYVNQPNIFGPEGADFTKVTTRRTFDAAAAEVWSYFADFLNAPVLVNQVTGKILESEAADQESGCNEMLRADFVDQKKLSGAATHVSRTDNLLQTLVETVDVALQPVAHPNKINLSMGFVVTIAAAQ